MNSTKSKKEQSKELKFLIATDIHLGHAQNHNELGNDSYLAFEQVLTTAKKQDVDFLLLGGDLFDEVNPTQKCIFKCLNLLKDNIFGDRELSIGVKGIMPNFSNQNLNISLPIFTIHGNHDYPSNDFGKISVCDLLHASNYVNYFGKHLNLVDQGQKKIVIKPLIFQKSGLATRLAIYGLGYIKDLKLYRMFQESMVIFQQPDKKEETVCIFILHQNRYKGKKGGVGASYQNCIHPEQLPKWMDLVIWGHEHEAVYKVQTESDISIFQPGSTVITSYIQAESFKKQCGLIIIKPNKQFEVKSILLEKSFRPMFTRTYFLQQIVTKYGPEAKENFHEYFDIELSKILGQNQAANPSKKPIIRIKVDYTGHEIIRLIRIEQKYRNLVANSNKIFTYAQKRMPKKNTFALEDEQVLDMIRKSKVPRNVGRQAELSQQILDKLLQEYVSCKLFFFEVNQLKDSLAQYANVEGRSNLADIKQMFSKELEKKCIENKKSIASFHINNDKDFKRLHQKLLKNVSDRQKGIVNSDFKIGDVKADIARLKNCYSEKQKQVQSILGVSLQKQTTSQIDPQQASKSTNGMSELSKKQKDEQKSSMMKSHRDSSNQGRLSDRLSNSSGQEDCCRRAQRQDYRENDTRHRFERANEMVQNQTKSQKKDSKARKKGVKFQGLP